MFGLCGSPKRSRCERKKQSKCPRKCKPKRKPQCPKKRKAPSCAKKPSCKPGKVTRNAFFNFLREFRVQHCEWHVTKIAVEGAKKWCSMSECERKKFIDQAQCAPKMKRKKKKRKSKCGRR